MKLKSLAFGALAIALAATPALAQTPPMTPDIPAQFSFPTVKNDWIKRTVMIPMRDGTKLYTVIMMMKGAHDAPILLTRTPYNAKRRAERFASPQITAELAQLDEPFVTDGYIRVYQDIRGKYGSEGDYVVTRPLIGPLNKTTVDHTTDTWDTIDWLVKNIPETNGRVGMIGSSYDGFTTLMGLINPHPALKAAVPQSAMVDGWMGDDWFHYGAFREKNMDYFTGQMTARGEGKQIPREGLDDYTNFLRLGSAGDFGKAYGLDQIPFYRKVTEHPSYDEFWSLQALDKTLAGQPLKVPTMWVGALWDQEDMWGTIHAYMATEPKDVNNDMNYLVLGPWRHSGVNYEQRQLNSIKLPGDTATQFRLEVLKPFLDEHLKTNGPKANTPPVYIFRTGANTWDRLQKWPPACEAGCPSKMKPLYLEPNQGLGFSPPPASGSGSPAYDEYISDPAKPVPYVRRPVRNDDGDQWRYWLTTDQRHVDGRTDVLTYTSEPLSSPMQISGAPIANLFASTSGTDSDWVVKIIDVYPDTVPSDLELGGYELPIAMDIFRGRYRESFETPKAILANAVEKYRFVMPTTNHVFLPGHRIMIQIQSSWFPLYDRNPQNFVPNIFFAKPADYVKATQRVFHAGTQATNIELPVVEMH